MKNSWKVGVVGVLFAMNSLFCIGQEANDSLSERPNFYKTAVYGNVGDFLLYVTGKIYAERVLFERQKSWKRERRGEEVTLNGRFATFIRVGYGGYASYDESSKYTSTQIGFMTGAHKHHFEMAFGATYFINGAYLFDQVIPSGTIGYRWQLPGERLIFRTGVGLPEAAYIGIGISFL